MLKKKKKKKKKRKPMAREHTNQIQSLKTKNLTLAT